MDFKQWWEEEGKYEGYNEAELAWDYQQQRIDDLLAKGYPASYVLVPIEPTEDMVKVTHTLIELGRLHDAVVKSIYKVMVMEGEHNESK